jgi:mitotic spindle assembly checkpoint protein MAD1
MLIVLQLAVVTEERNKLRILANLKNGEAGDESSSANPIQVVFPSICHHLTY